MVCHEALEVSYGYGIVYFTPPAFVLAEGRANSAAYRWKWVRLPVNC